MSRITLLFLFIFGLQTISAATHNRAGEITYRQIGNQTIEASIITYSKASVLGPDRDSLQIDWGDGQTMWIQRVNGPDVDNNGIPDGVALDNDYKINIYAATHTYADFGIYRLSMTDANREHDILNINFPNSDNVPFHIQTEVHLGSTINNSPQLLQAPIDIAYVNQPFIHVPVPFDEDGDSIAYRMITPLMAQDIEVPNYLELTAIAPGVNNNLSFKENTGLLVWDSPQQEGLYNIAIEILTYRNGELNGSIIRDMQIQVMPEENLLNAMSSTPVINNQILELEIGDTLHLDILAEDADPNQQIEISSISGLYDFVAVPPVFEFDNMNANNGQATFYWIVQAGQIRSQPDQIVFKCTDNLGLANYLVLSVMEKNNVNNVSSIENDSALSFFPNPTSDILTIERKNEAIILFKIWNTSGKLMHKGSLVRQLTLEIKNWPSGSYFIQMEDGSQHTFIKQ